MSQLTKKERTQVNAALCLIHDQGYDASAITAAATRSIAVGHAPAAAYSLALNAFAAQNVDLAQSLSKVTRLIGASSADTIDAYDRALNAYITTGNDTAMTALAPMIAADSMALAIKAGEMQPGDTGAAAAALGHPLSDVMQQAFAAASVAIEAPEEPHGNGYQLSPFDGPGMLAPKAQLVPVEYHGFAPASGALNGQSLTAVREAARESAAGRSPDNISNSGVS
jgi:hypothetical protein